MLGTGSQKKGRCNFRVMDPIPCCIACGRYPEDLDWNMRALKEREDWKNLMKNPREDRSYMVKAEDIESMYFHKRPWTWACYYRAILHRPRIDYVNISGITQMTCREPSYWSDPPHLPRDPQIARIGGCKFIPEPSSCTPFWTADILHPENNQRAPCEQIGYPVRAHCWILVDRIIGLQSIKADLKLFLMAVEIFWAKNVGLWRRHLWIHVGYEPDSDPYPDAEGEEWAIVTESDVLSQLEGDWSFGDRHNKPNWENPAIVPKIQQIIEQATTQNHSESRRRRRCPQRTPSSLVSHLPLDIAIEIVEFSKLAGIEDTRNMLAAFGWRLPDSYWKSRCKMDLIFEYADLQKTNCPVDWQCIGLPTEELMEDPTWERKTGLGTRRWIFGQLRQMKTIFLDLVDQEKLNPGCLIEPARRKYPLRKRFL